MSAGSPRSSDRSCNPPDDCWPTTVADGHAAAPPNLAINSRRRIHPSQGTTRLAYSITLVAAGASGFLTLIQSGERPDRYGLSRRFATMPSSPMAQA
jgi:hypothetical protein